MLSGAFRGGSAGAHAIRPSPVVSQTIMAHECAVQLWLDQLSSSDRGHAHIHGPADELLLQLRKADLTNDVAVDLYARLVQGIADEVDTAVRWAAQPPATMERDYHRFMRLQEMGTPYVVTGNWNHYLSRIIMLLSKAHDALLMSRGIDAPIIDELVAGMLFAPLHVVVGSALRGPQFEVTFLDDVTKPLATFLGLVGFKVPTNERASFSDADGFPDESAFCLGNDDVFRDLLLGAARARDEFSRRVLTFYARDDEVWVRALAEKLQRA